MALRSIAGSNATHTTLQTDLYTISLSVRPTAGANGSSLVGASVAASGDGGKPLWLVQDLTNTAATLRWHVMACS